MTKTNLIILALTLPLAAAQAQTSRAIAQNYQHRASSLVSSYRNALTSAGSSASTNADDTALSPYIYQITSPGVYYSAPVADQLSIDSEQSVGESTTPGMNYRDALQNEVNNLLTRTYADSPQLFHYTEAQVDAERMVDATAEAEAKAEDIMPIIDNATQISDVTDVMSDVDVDLEVEKPNFWTKSGSFKLQFTQNYFSDNWYKGGNNNITMFSNLLVEANYNDQKRIQWDNRLDMRLGFMTASSDTCHKYLTNNDRIALSSKLGVKAAKFWNYTLSLEANSQFLPGYRSNDRRKYSDFISPLDVFVSLGMDYKPTFANKNELSVALLPFSYKMRYISAEDETIHKTYNMADKDFQQDFGSRIEVKSKVKVAENLTWQCRFYYFTSYEYTESELENIFSFQFNKYISSEVNTLWRFDDNRSPKDYDRNLGYFQFKEFFTLGLSYKF